MANERNEVNDGRAMKVWRRYLNKWSPPVPLWGVHRHRANAEASAHRIAASGTAKEFGYGQIVVKPVEYDDDMTVLDE